MTSSRFSLTIFSILLASAIVSDAGSASAATIVGVRVSPVADTIAVGNAEPFRATAIYDDNTSLDVTATATWLSSAPANAAVDGSGIVTGLQVGDATITVSYSGKSASAIVRVRGVDAYLYTSGWAGAPPVVDSIYAFSADLIGGGLTAIESDPTGLSPWGVAVDPAGRFVYTANRTSNTVSAFAITPATGALTLLGSYPTGGNWALWPVIEPTGHFLYVANVLGSSISAFAIGADGTLTPLAGSPFSLSGGVSYMTAHPGGGYLYVATADHQLAVLAIDGTGAIAPIAGSPFWFDAFPNASTIGGLAVDRGGRFLFATDNGREQVRSFVIDPATGALTGEATAVADLYLSRGVVVDPGGTFVVAGGYNGVYVFTFDPTTGALTQLAGSPFASDLGPGAFAFDHTGTQLYAVNGSQGGLSWDAVFSVSLHHFDPATGVVTRFSTVNTGVALMGVALAANNAPGPALTQVQVAPANPTVQTTVFGITRAFTATGTYSDGRSGPLAGATWTSSDPSVATINPVTGVATLLAYGTTTITAARSGISNSTLLTVAPAPITALYVTPLNALIAPGGTQQFVATAVYADGVGQDVTASAVWTSASPGVATVASGLATGVAGGTATISATVSALTSAGTLVVKAGNTVVFAADQTGGQIFGYSRSGGASLTAANGSPYAAGAAPDAVVLDPTGRMLYVADATNNQLLAFQVDGGTGQVLPAPGFPVATRNWPRRLAMDPRGRFLYVVYQGDFTLGAYQIDAITGRLTPTTVDQALPYQGRSLTVDASGRFLYVGTGQGDGNDKIRAFRIDQTTGALTTAGDSPTGALPEDLLTDRTGRFLYVANGGPSRISTYAINSGTGLLTLVGTAATNTYPYRLALHPQGTALFVAERFSYSVSAFHVAPDTGTLTAAGTVTVNRNINGLAIEPLGNYVYAATDPIVGSAAQLLQFGVDGAGTLGTPVAYAAGSSSSDVAVGLLAPGGSVTLTGLSVTPSSTTVYGHAPGHTRAFTVVGTYSDGSQEFLTASAAWTTSNPAAVSVSATGVATTLAVPSGATLTATIGALSASATLTASNVPARLALTPVTETMGVGSVRSYRAAAVYPDDSAEDITPFATWSSSDNGVATVDAAGMVTGMARGDVIISASTLGVTGTAAVRVRDVDAYLYTSAWQTTPDTHDSLYGFHADLIGGGLTAIGASVTDFSPSGIAIDPTGRFAYTANLGSNTVSAFAITAATGALTPLGSYPTGGKWPSSIVIEPTGHFVYAGNSSGATSVAAFAIGADGTLTPVPGSPFAVPGAIVLAVHPAGGVLYMTTGADHRIAAYRIDPATGALTAVAGSPFWFDNNPAASNMLGLAVHRSGRFLLASDNGSSTVHVFSLDPATGALTGEVMRSNALVSRGLAFDPAGQFVVAPGQTGAAGQSGLFVFAFDAATGTITAVPGSPFASDLLPGAIAFDHTGTQLYGANGQPGASTVEMMESLSLHHFDPATGVITRFATVNVGQPLMAVALTATDIAGPALTQITVSPAGPTVQTTVFGITRAFTATGTYSDGRSGPLPGVTWTSSDPSVATINPVTGVVTLLAYGTTTITAARSGISGSTLLTVAPAPLTAIYVSPLNTLIAPGANQQFIATAIYADGITRDMTATATWTSSTPAVGTVVAGGMATGVAGGTTTISAAVGGQIGAATLVVKTGNAVVFTVDKAGAQVFGFSRSGGAALTAASGSPLGVGTAPDAVALDPTGRLLYVADATTNQLRGFQVDGVNGQLVAAPGFPVATHAWPRRLAIDPRGRFLYVVHQGDFNLGAYRIDAVTGQLTPTTVDQPLPYQGRSLTVDAGGHFLYVGAGQGDGNDKIRVLRIDQTTGALTTVGDVATGALPEDLLTDRTGRFLYVANGGPNVISTYAINLGNGALTLVTTTPTNTYPYRLALHPLGTALYVAERFSFTVSSFQVTPATGALTAGATVTVTRYLNSLAIEPLGNYLYAATDPIAGVGSELLQFAADGTAALGAPAVYAAGNSSLDVTAGLLAPAGAVTLSSLAITPASATIYGRLPGGTRQLTVTGTYSDGSQAFLTGSVTWTSGTPAAVGISTTGVATALAVPSSVTITATAGGHSATATVIASSTPSGLFVAPATETLGVNSFRTFSATATYPDSSADDVTASATWSSSNTSVATVDASGHVTGIASGDAVITADYSGLSASANVRVRGSDGYLYASGWASAPPTVDSVYVYRADLSGGGLTAVESDATGLSPWGIAIDPAGRFAYVANRTSNTVSAFAITAATGGLTLIGTYPTGGQWALQPVVDPTGRFLYVSNVLGATSVAAFAIGADGTLTPVAGSPFAVPGASVMAVHPAGTVLYLATGADHRIAAYRIDPATGALAALAGSPYWFDDIPTADNLLGLAVHRSGRFLLASDNGTGNVHVFALDSGTGALTGEVMRAAATVTRDLAFDRTGRFVVAPGQTGLYVFSFDSTAGTLTAVAGSPFASDLMPGALAFDHTGTQIYAVNGTQGAYTFDMMQSISLHHFDPATGVITRFATLNSGVSLMGVAITAGAPPDTTPPPVPIITSYPADPSPRATSSYSFAFSDTENGAAFECQLDGAAFAACSSPAAYSGPLAPGAHTFSVRALDMAGNRSQPASFGWVVSAQYPASLSGVTASQSIVYGTSTVTLSGSVSAGGLFPPAGETITVTANGATATATLGVTGDFVAVLDTHAFAAAPSTPYAVTYSYAGDADFTASNDATTAITVTPRAASVTPNAAQKTYGAPDPVFDGVLGGFLAGDGVTASYTRTPGETVTGGPYTISASLDPAGVLSNYAITYNTAPFTITPATATVTVTDYIGVYDGLPHGVSGTATGVSGENLSAFLNLGTTMTNAGITMAHWTFGGDANYAPLAGDATISIAMAQPSIAVTGYTGVYDGLPHGATGTATGVGGENLNVFLNLGSTFTAVPGGTAHWTFAGSMNYVSESGDVPITITPAQATIVVNGYTGVYDGLPHGATGTATGVGGENLSAFLNLGATFTNVPGGVAQWTFSDPPNYAQASGTVNIVITPATPTTLDGRMHGAGFIDQAGKHHHFVFRVSQTQAQRYGRFEYWVNDARVCREDDDFDGDMDGGRDDSYGRGHHAPPTHFEATSVDSVTFSDDPGFTPGRGAKQPSADTVKFSGQGKWNGRAGYIYEVVATDRGEPGRGRDTFSLVVKDARGVIVASVSGPLDGGNIQSTRLRR